jgi:hypothetical protein
LYERLYEGPGLTRQTASVRSLVGQLWESASERPLRFHAAVARLGLGCPEGGTLGERFIDAVAAMTDRQVLEVSRTLRLPRAVWSVALGAGPGRERPSFECRDREPVTVA